MQRRRFKVEKTWLRCVLGERRAMTSFHSGGRKEDLSGLRDRRQIALFVEREEALLKRAEREEQEEHVRNLKFERLERAVLLVLGVAIGIAIALGCLRDPKLLELAGPAAAVWGGIGFGLSRQASRRARLRAALRATEAWAEAGPAPRREPGREGRSR
jgi:hypothetical protein